MFSKVIHVHNADSYLSLYQVVPLCANVFQETHDVYCALLFDLSKHAVQYNVGPCSTHASTVGKGNKGTLVLFILTIFVSQCRTYCVQSIHMPMLYACFKPSSTSIIIKTEAF